MTKILLLQGANLTFLGRREPEIYGSTTPADLEVMLQGHARDHSYRLEIFYTNIEGERCEASRGDLILTPNGTWHDHGNEGTTPVIWIDMLDWPLMEMFDCAWVD